MTMMPSLTLAKNVNEEEQLGGTQLHLQDYNERSCKTTMINKNTKWQRG
jgi:hypothetical protein